MPSIPGIDFTPFIQTLLPVFPPAVSQIFLPFFHSRTHKYPFCVSSRLFYRKNTPTPTPPSGSPRGASHITGPSFIHHSYNILSDLFCSFFLPSHSAIQTDIVHENLCCPQISINIYIIQTRFCLM